jgi:gamma-glutamylcyclotransferase (GGCT)/AIG2-like uncharacterized protein YtfP
MKQSERGAVWLFAYGTLRHRQVQLALFGRELDGKPDALVGYKLSPLQITDPMVVAISGTSQHTMLCETGDSRDQVPGLVFEVSPGEITAADEFEVSDVKRVSLRLASGKEAFVYVSASP